MRLLTLNIWQEQGPWRRRLDVAAAQIAAIAPDVVCLQEVRQRGDEIPNQAIWLAGQLGGGWTSVHVAAQPWGGGDEGVAILTPWPVLDRRTHNLPSRDDNRRVCLAAEIDVDGVLLWVATTHLAYRLADGALREEQVAAVDGFVRELRASGQTAIVAGDFNAIPESDEIRFLVGLHSVCGRRVFWQDAWARCHGQEPGPTWCVRNPYTEQLGWFPRDRRLDYVFVTPETREGHGRIVACDIVCDTPEADGVFPSDHWGVLATLDP